MTDEATMREAMLALNLKAAIGEIERLRDTLAYAEAALADIGDADREPGDDLAWCEARAAEALPRVREVLKHCQVRQNNKMAVDKYAQ